MDEKRLRDIERQAAAGAAWVQAFMEDADRDDLYSPAHMAYVDLFMDGWEDTFQCGVGGDEQAVWTAFMGEVVRRNLGGRWRLRTQEPPEHGICGDEVVAVGDEEFNPITTFEMRIHEEGLTAAEEFERLSRLVERLPKLVERREPVGTVERLGREWQRPMRTQDRV